MLVIGLGASAGGIEAFQSFFECLPPEPGFAVVLALHLPAARKSMLCDIISSWTSMRVQDVTQGMPIKANAVYVVPPHTTVSISDRALWLTPIESQEGGIIRPIDSLFDAIATAYNENAVAIVLSGTGSDGALGIKAIKARGGLTIAQGTDGKTPEYADMPGAAISTGAVDLVLHIDQIAPALLKYVTSLPDLQQALDAAEDDSLRLRICQVMHERIGHDFSGYRDKTFNRRVRRRMQVLGVASLPDYLLLIERDTHEVDELFRDLLIRVTSFFRDPATFTTLTTVVMPRLFSGAGAETEIRVWVPGCATGEEAYSLAITLCEYREGLKLRPKIQIFATDIDDSAITLARLGRYPATLVSGVSEERLRRFFHLSDGIYFVSREIRELVTFSTHSLVRDPPFSRMNLVSCRNLLIYFDPELQEKVIPLFHYSLAKGGILLLGSSESTARHQELFATIDKESRIFLRRDGKRSRAQAAVDVAQQSGPRRAATQPVQIALDSFQMPQESVRAASEGGVQQGEFKIEPIARTTDHPIKEFFKRALGTAPSLGAQLRQSKEQLAALGDKHQTALEELRSAIEELHSVNEEMQSTNEELETSKEELQSVNEELRTVNMRLSEKVEELDDANSDLRNLFESTEIATVFLDEFLLIRSFTPAIGTLFNLIPSDQGRPLTDIKSHLDYQDLHADVSAVLQTLQPLERRVTRDDDTAHYMMRILPYRNPDSSVGGTLVTFVDITNIVQAESAMRAADERKDVFLATLSHELRNPLAPIRTAAGILASERLSDQEVKRVQAIISRQATHMMSLLDDLLDISRVTRGMLVLKKDYVELNTLISNVVEVMAPAVGAKSQRLRFEPAAASTAIEVDPVRITQALTNLISNAVKYTPEQGELLVACQVSTDGVSISVTDSGIGISPEHIGQVFGMFNQVDPRFGAADGLGIGLALVKGLVEMHGGRVEASSAGLGHGSTFTMFLPTIVISRLAASEQRSVEGSNTAGAPRRILVADDNHDGAGALEIYLRMHGHEVEVAHSGEDALEKARSFRPDVAVLDIGMPMLNGYEVAERIRQEAWGNDMTLIALTGWGQVDDRRRALAAGFDKHVTKPVDPAELVKLID